MLQKICLAASALVATTSLYAQDTATAETKTAKPLISASVDVYYRYNLSNPKGEALNNYTSFTNSQNSFELGMASVKLEHTLGKVGMVADLGFGKRAEEFSYADEKTRFAIKQLNLSYALRENVKITAGSWATHVGYELVDPQLNRNYSMSYMFSKGPFLHTGIKTDLTLGNSGFMVGFANPTDLKSASFSRKYLIAQYSISMAEDKLKTYVNFQAGKPGVDAKMRQYDLVVTGTLSDAFSIGYNGTISRNSARSNGKYEAANSWWGSALYLNADPASWLGFTLRSEYFNDEEKLTGVFADETEGGSVFATTLSANFKIQNLRLIPELRVDNASRAIFTKGNGAASKNTTTALLAAVYTF